MQAIETKFLGPTNFRGARIKATAQAGSVTISYPYDERSGDHTLAAIALALKLGWAGRWVEGGRADGRGSVFVAVAS